MHISDWYPTLLSAAGAQMTYPKSKKLHLDDKEDDRFLNNGVGEVPLDGKNLWNVIQFGEINDEIAYEKRELLLDLNPMGNCSFSACGAIRKGDWKFIRGANMLYSAEAKSFPDWTSWFRFACCMLPCFKMHLKVNPLGENSDVFEILAFFPSFCICLLVSHLTSQHLVECCHFSECVSVSDVT